MKTANLKVVRVGNSRGVRLPAPLLAHYRIKSEVSAELRPEGILLKPARDGLLSWEETARAMVADRRGEFADLEKAAAADGLAALDR